MASNDDRRDQPAEAVGRIGRQSMKSTSEQNASLSRRHFLRGLGVCVALPAFESLGLARPLAAATEAKSLAATATGAPLRTAFVYFPNGAIPKAWWPTGAGGDFQLKNSLQPLEPYKSSVQVLGGLNHRTADGGPDGAGDHARGNGTFLTGVRLKKSATDIRAGVSIDQVIARRDRSAHAVPLAGAGDRCDPQIGGLRLGLCVCLSVQPLLELADDADAGGNQPAAGLRAPFRQRSAGRAARKSGAPAPASSDPFSTSSSTEARSMQRRLQSGDKDKLDQYLTGVREIETRIEKVERLGEPADPAIDTPVGVPADYAEYIQLMFDILVLAFQTDSTRVATLMLAHDGSNRSFDHIGIAEGHHDLTHHRNRPEWIGKVADIDQWYVRQFATFLDKLETIQRRRRQVAAAQLDDRLRERQCRRQPAHA